MIIVFGRVNCARYILKCVYYTDICSVVTIRESMCRYRVCVYNVAWITCVVNFVFFIVNTGKHRVIYTKLEYLYNM